jgi:hypothetical protein
MDPKLFFFAMVYPPSTILVAERINVDRIQSVTALPRNRAARRMSADSSGVVRKVMVTERRSCAGSGRRPTRFFFMTIVVTQK